MPASRQIWATAIAVAIALVLSACGENEQVPTTAPTARAPSSTTPGAAPSPTAQVEAHQPVVIDLASAAPLLTIFAIDQGDLRNDIPSMAVGDFNGDGIDDFLLGARFGDGPENSREDGGEAYVILGRRDLSGTVNLALGQQNITLFGANPGDNLGFSVAAADLNDDGVDDIVVSSPMSEGIKDPDYRTDRGEVYIVYGGGDLPSTIDMAEGAQDVTIVAAEGYSLMGDSMATGDVNGDDIEDIVLGATFAGRVPGSPHGGPRTELGEVYAIFGSRALPELISIPEHQQDFTISGPEQFSELGDAVAVGDVNGDGLDDIIAVAEAADGPQRSRPNVGVAYVAFGSDRLGGIMDTAQDQQDLTVIGVASNDALGFCAASGDVNDDDIEDILLVAQRAAGAAGTKVGSGEGYVVLGSRQLKGTIDALAGDQDITISGADAHDLLSSCSLGHDVSGDGIGDIILGTGFGRGPDNGRDAAGEAYVILGSPALEEAPYRGEDSYDAVIFGAEAGDRLGSAVGAGDLNGDGKEEVILVADEAGGPDNSRPGAGEVYVLPGLASGR